MSVSVIAGPRNHRKPLETLTFSRAFDFKYKKQDGNRNCMGIIASQIWDS